MICLKHKVTHIRGSPFSFLGNFLSLAVLLCLHTEHFCIFSVPGDQLVVTAPLGKLAICEKKNAIGKAGGGEAVGDEYDRRCATAVAAVCGVQNGVVQLVFRHGVES